MVIWLSYSSEIDMTLQKHDNISLDMLSFNELLDLNSQNVNNTTCSNIKHPRNVKKPSEIIENDEK